jgi:hypothetical protein
MRARRALPTLGVVALAAAGASSCGTKAPEDPSFILIELDAVPEMGVPPKDAVVQVLSGQTSLATVCMRLAAPGASSPASFVLSRAYGQDAGARISVVVTGFDVIDGDSEADVGNQFSCPIPTPALPSEAVSLSVDFCASKSQKLVFYVGASCCHLVFDGGAPDGGDADAGTPVCGCLSGFVCGAGLSVEGNPCGPEECCSSSVSDACALEPAPNGS